MIESEDGELLKFVAFEKKTVRGMVNDDGLGRYDIDGITLPEFLPDEIDKNYWPDDEQNGTEYEFWITVNVWKPTENEE